MFIIATTVANEADAKRLARQLLEMGCACVHHVHIASTYQWEGELVQESEWRVEAKHKGPIEETLAWLDEHHPYEVPMILHWPVTANASYRAWC